MNEHFESAFNQWQDDYTNNPDGFEDTTKTALNHLRERLDGKEPTYGQSAAATFQAYLGRVQPPSVA
jgi:hypothetical protein